MILFPLQRYREIFKDKIFDRKNSPPSIPDRGDCNLITFEKHYSPVTGFFIFISIVSRGVSFSFA